MAIGTLIITLLIGAVAGWIASTLIGGIGFGLIGNIVVGVAGAFLAGYLLPVVGVSLADGALGAILHATIGAIIVLILLKLLKR